MWASYFLSILLTVLPNPALDDQEAVLVQSHQLSPAFWSDPTNSILIQSHQLSSAFWSDGVDNSILVQSHQLSPAFWSDGVDNSKRILEKILRKIRSYEEDISKTLNIHKDLALKLTNKLMQDKNGQMWVDEGRNVKLVLDKDSQCYEIQNLENLIPNIGYTCQEVDQLHGIGYHHVYEQCDDPIGHVFFSNFTVDYQVCLSGFYPWIDKSQYSVCIMKSYKHNFLACFCSMVDGKPFKRSFCITKFECLFGGRGVSEQKGLELSDTCFKKMHYFIEINHHTANWVRMAQVSDKLRVRAPYHQESPCFQKQFEAEFDIGQIDVNNLEAGILSLTTLTEEGLSKFTKTVSTCPTGANLGLNEHLMENIVDTLNQHSDQCFNDRKCFTENDDIINSRNEIEKKIIEKRSSKQVTPKEMDDTFCSSENLFQKDQSSPKITLPAGVTINDASQKGKTTEAEKNNIDKDNENACGIHNDKNKPDVNSNCYLIRNKKRIWTASHCKFSLDVYTLISGVPFLLMNMYSDEAIGRSARLYYFKEGSRLLPIVTGTYWFIRYWSGLPFKSLEDSFDFQDFLFGLCLLLVGWLFCNYDEYAIFAIKVSGLCLCIDAPIHYLTQFITYKRDISLYVYLILPMNWAGFGFYVFQNLWKITKTISQANIDKEKRRFKRRVGRFIQRDEKLNNAKTSTMEKVKEKSSKNTEETDIPEVSMEPVFCQSYCENVPNLGTVSVNCTARCFLKYHQQCWKNKMDSLNIKTERSILHMDCSTSDCWGKVKEIVSYDASGEELPRKISMTPNEILKFKQKHPKSKKSQDEVKCKPNKAKVERTKRKESETDDQEQRKSSLETAPGKKNVASKSTANKISSESSSVENNKETSEENVQSENIKSENQESHENPRIFKKSVSMLPTEESSMDAKMQKKKQKLKKTMSLDEFRADVVNTGMESKDCLEEHKSVYPQQVFSPSKPPILPAFAPPTSPPPKSRYSTPPPSIPPKFSGKGIVFPPKPVSPLLSRFSTPPPPIPKQIVQKNISSLPPPTSSVHFSEPKSKQDLDTSKLKTTNPFFDQISSQRSSMYSDIRETVDLPSSANSKDCINGPTDPLLLPSLGSTPAVNLFQKHPLSPSLLPLSTAAQQITLSPFISPLQLNISSTTFEKEIPTSSSPFISPIQMNIPSTTFEKEISASSSPDLSPPLSSIQSSMSSFSRDLPMSSHFSSHITSLSDHLLKRSDSRNFLGYPLFQRSTNLKWHSEDTMDSSDNSDMIDEDEEYSEQIKTTGSTLQIGNEWTQSKYTKIEREINSHKTPTVEFVHDCQNQTTTQGRQNLIDGENIIPTFIYCPGEDSHSQTQYEKDTIHMSDNTQSSPIKSNQMENIIESISPVSHPSDKNLSPLTKIVAKKFPHISISDINVCLEKVLSNYDVANTTLSEFINLIGDQVENVMDSWKDEIYMSDEDDSVTEPSELHDDLIDAILEDIDECAICTELLEVHLETMDPCGHIFHTECIRSWAKKEATCPQCRANIQFSP